ncbi:glycosyltransferase [Mixta calida]|uniref:Glycosyltransferase 2-like domain-containing protein n=1 Tax=Mixta calida TaxID=665913 RepID=A0ABM6S326_9GAMM|nr:glycosyltransferase [Mixta calida]AUY25855.1 hypothetical protein C2E16_13655 [Mixta calida]KAF0859833.1 hypothetical protein Y888_09255 [Mixta calida B021323]
MISVVMSVYNGELYLDKAIKSILLQTFHDFEFIIINDGSSDNSLDIIKKYSVKDPRIKFITRENRGLISSLNEAVNLSKFEYIARMDADDIALPTRLESIIKIINDDNSLNIISSGSILIDMNGNVICKSPLRITEKKILDSLPGKNYISHPTVAFKKEFFLKCGGYDPKDIGIEDVALWLRMRESDIRYKFIKKHLLYYRINLNSVRRLDANKYQKILFKECLVNHDKKAALSLIKKLPASYSFLALLMTMIPSFIIDIYTKNRNIKKITNVYNKTRNGSSGGI